MTRTHSLLLVGVAGVFASGSFLPLRSVSHDATLKGDGTSESPLGIARNGVRREQLADGSVDVAAIRTADAPTAGQLLGFDGTRLSWLTPVPSSGDGAQVVDSRGTVVGPLVANIGVIVKVGSQWLLLQANAKGIVDNGVFLLYVSDDCSGTAYAPAGQLPPIVQHQGTESYYPAAPYQILAINSASYNGSCFPNSVTEAVGVATRLPVDVSAYVPPLTVQSQ